MKNPLLKKLLIITLLSINLSAMAEDIDLFVGTPPSTTDVPNVLIILDNTANWSQPFDNEMAALSSVVSALPEDKFRVGLMAFSESGGSNSGNDGGYVRAAMRLMSSTNKVTYQNLVNGLGKVADRGNGGKLGKVMEEAYLYYSGGVPYAGNNKAKTDYAGNASGTASSNAVYALANNALLSKAGSPYVSPIIASCAKNYIIYISNGAVQDNTADTSQPTAALAAVGGNTTTIPISPTGSETNIADEWARFMKKSDLNITTYTVDINKVTNGQGPGFTALLKSMASVSSGKYFDVTDSGSEIADALKGIFSEIQSVNSVFASVSLPVSVNTQGTFLNQVYIGMFRPDADAFPRWNGNLKQYKLGFINNVLQLLDADDKSAISSGGTGFIAECARSFWTPSTLDSYWAFRPQGNCLITNADISNFPDGNVVEKGAQAFKLRSSTARNMKTCANTSCASLANFDSTTATRGLLGAETDVERDELINWQRGQDIDNEHGTDDVMPSLVGGAKTSTVMRPSAHGDVVHSRPVAINHGTDASPQVVVYYGSNDGLLRAVNGNRNGTTAGSELWSFVAPEFYPKIKRIRENTPSISFPGFTTGTPTPQPKDYGVDGAVTAYKDASNTWIYSTMRRGGRAVYAFDVTTPANPSLKWKIGCDATNCTSGFEALGQTWSSPKVLTASGYGSGTTPMLIMGGGYDDICHDNPNTACTSPSKGNKVYLMDANTGALLKAFNTENSVIADITLVADNVDAPVKYAYVADLGGNIYRISGASGNTPIGTTAPSDWTITKIAAFGGSGEDNRKFMFTPDWVEDGGIYTLLLGSGDREKPLRTYTLAAAVKNRFYMVQDKPTDPNWLSSESGNCGASLICNNSLVAISGSVTPSATTLAAKKGWYLALTNTEQVVTNAITVFNTVTFSTHQPTAPLSGACTTLGTARVYNLDYTNGATRVGLVRGETIAGGGLPPSPVAGMVTLDNGQTVPFIIGAKPDSALQGGNPPAPPSAIRPKSRVYWNIKK
ncbi:MAG: PilC/PilY family type IV pilus protein [Pseudomonadota bacterium]